MSYHGAAVVAGTEVRVHLSGRFDPTDGRFHWNGRIEPAPALVALLRAGRRDVTVHIGTRTADGRLGEADPWGGVRLTGTGTPPWEDEEEDE
ncbi:DUF4873 domain-containing protein [Hamadaea tsunoensis]|uniref:DUF4873 domain-containing protein n=1 Tax=Hamadaea tsunoensis TaxID=53368 RepID=UPI00041FA555|nr:DUF4873 domain-containing protein [Hamadaea tsunoensis]